MNGVSFNLDDAQRAGDDWNFNCGPAALCAVLNKTPGEIRPHLLEFEQKGYTNPTLMANILRGLNVSFTRKYESARGPEKPRIGQWPNFGLVRIQWAGPWTKPNVPMRVRYRHTHWVASRCQPLSGWRDNRQMPQPHWPGHEIFDINAMCVGGWLSYDEWANEFVPWLLPQVEPKSDGEWWPTHCWEIDR